MLHDKWYHSPSNSRANWLLDFLARPPVVIRIVTADGDSAISTSNSKLVFFWRPLDTSRGPVQTEHHQRWFPLATLLDPHVRITILPQATQVLSNTLFNFLILIGELLLWYTYKYIYLQLQYIYTYMAIVNLYSSISSETHQTLTQMPYILDDFGV